MDGFDDEGVAGLKSEVRLDPAGGQPRPGREVFLFRSGSFGFPQPFRDLSYIRGQAAGRLGALSDGFKSGSAKELFPNLPEQSRISVTGEKKTKDRRCPSRDLCFNDIMPYPQIHQWYHCDSSRPKRVIVADLPRITPRFRYQQAIRLGSCIGSGILTFSREDFQVSLTKRLVRDGEKHLHPFDAALLAWVKDVDNGAAEPCLLPVGWFGIENVLLELIESRKYSAFCSDCQRTYEPSEINVVDLEWCSASGYSGINCPSDHRLFRTEVVHVVF